VGDNFLLCCDLPHPSPQPTQPRCPGSLGQTEGIMARDGMAGITLKIDGLDQLQKMLQFTDPKTFAKANRAGIAKATSAIKTQVAKEIGRDYNIKAARIKQDISRATIAPDGSSATIRFSRRPPTLAQYGMKPGTRGGSQPGLGRGRGWGKPAKPGRPLTATILRAEGRKVYRGAFVAVGNSGNEVVFRKDGQGKLYAVYGPSIGSIFLGQGRHSQRLQASAARLINDEFIKGFEKKLSDIARGYGGR